MASFQPNYQASKLSTLPVVKDRLPMVVSCSALYRPGQEELCLLMGRLRALDAQKFPGNIYAEVHNATEDVKSERGLMFMFKWTSFAAHSTFLCSPESLKYIESYNESFILTSLKIVQWTLLDNPLQLRNEEETEKYSFPQHTQFQSDLPATYTSGEETSEVSSRFQFARALAESTAPMRQKNAFVVTVIAQCNPSNYLDLCDLMQVLEVSAQIENGCEVFEVYTRTPCECFFLLYGVFRGEDDFRIHAQQSYSFFRCGALKLVSQCPQIKTWTRMDPFL